MSKGLLKDSIGWGFLLWLIGYALGFALFFFVPVPLIGWFIMPVCTLLTLWVLIKRVKSEHFLYYLVLAVVWTAIAVVFDYLFIVQLLKPADGYYKLDVYLYYVMTFLIPLIVGIWKNQRLRI